MGTVFPKHSVEWRFEEPTVVRRFTISLVEMALLTGVAMRLYRALVTTHGSGTWVWLLAMAGGTLLLCALTTVHLANYPTHQWVWRAPTFGLAEVAAEAAMSLVLIGFGREPAGTSRAVWGDWLPLTLDTLWKRELVICVWALVLAGTIWVVRRTILRAEKIEEEPAIEEARL